MRIETAKVIDNKKIAHGIWKMEMECQNIHREITGPGQFIHIKVDPTWEIPLRRPMSIAGIRGNILTLIYKILGKGTRQLSQFHPDQSINILGPLGNTFKFPDDVQYFPILVGGGVGIAPILWLHHIFVNKLVPHALIIGAKTANEHFLQHSPNKNIFITTDDGSLGIKGTVIPALKNLLNEIIAPKIFACGPMPMLKAIQIITINEHIDCQMALESYMGCGIGICQSCVIKRKNVLQKKHSYHNYYSLVCKEGPVYSAHEIIL